MNNESQFYNRNNVNNVNNQNPYSNPAPQMSNAYMPPQYGRNNKDFTNGESSMHLPSNFSIPTSIQINSKILQVDNRIVNFSQYIFFLSLLMIFSLFGMFSSIFVINNIDLVDTMKDFNLRSNQKTFETINFFVNLIHIAVYVFSMQSFTSQMSNNNLKSQYMIAGLAVLNLCYFFIYIFLFHVSFFTWCLDIFFLMINSLIYVQASELTILFVEKEKLKKFDIMLV